MVTEDVFENDIEVLSDKLERLGIKKTCQVSKASAQAARLGFEGTQKGDF